MKPQVTKIERLFLGLKEKFEKKKKKEIRGEKKRRKVRLNITFAYI